MKRFTRLVAFALVCVPAASQAHSVAQVQTAKRIAPSTIVALDPQGNPVPGGMGTDTTAQVGDVLTFIIRFTPLPNSASRGAGGYITEYVPANTEVVGARLIDALGNTLRPKRGAFMDDGWGPRGRHNGFDGMGLGQGSLSQLYADTGIFFSQSPLTLRSPANQFITVQNGLTVTPVPTGAGQLDNFLAFTGPPFYAHNEWDRVQAIAYGANGGSVVSNGTGNTPFQYGSPVAGPETHYLFEKVLTPACSDGMDNDGDGSADYPADAQCASSLDNDETGAASGPVGPWQRIKYTGSEIGAGAATNCQSCQGQYVRVGVPTSLGWELSADNPAPPGTNAVRFAVGELIVGEEYFAEISLRVLGLPLDPNMGADVNCSEVFGGDAAMPQNGQDNSWRYFVPVPACVSLNLQFDLDVDKLLAVQGDTLTYTIKGKNLSVNPQTNVVVTDTFEANELAFDQVLVGPAPTVANGTITWPAMSLQPGDEYTFQWTMDVTGNNLSTLNKARYVSDQLPAPGFSVVALTTIEPIVVLKESASVQTTPPTTPPATTAGSTVRYSGAFTNVGTGAATTNGASYVEVTLPSGFSFCGPPACASPTINGVNVANPTTQPGNNVRFTSGLATIPANGGTLVVSFDATVGGAVAPGQYFIDLQGQFRDNGIGRDVEVSAFGLAPLLVDIGQSEAPAIDEPAIEGDSLVTGTTSEGQGTTVVVYVNGNPVAPVVAGAGGVFSAAVPTLYAGQHINATAQSAGEVASVQSSPDVVVQGLSAISMCNDGVDNDGDGFTDFPADPGCDSAADPDETDVPQCSNGIDDDADGLIDFPEDPSCSSFLDPDESGPPACSNGVDDDGDGLVDFPADTGCDSATDPNELDLPACANGLDDDNDGLVDYPVDPGCDSATDNDETDLSGAGGAGGAGGNGSGPTSATATVGSGQIGDPPDVGGVPEDETTEGASSEDGCNCRTGGSRGPSGAIAALLGLAALARRRLRPTRAAKPSRGA